MEEILIGRNHVSEQDMQNALRGAFLEGFKEGTSISQRSMFASTFLDAFLRETRPEDRNEERIAACWSHADMFIALGRATKKKEQVENPTTGH